MNMTPDLMYLLFAAIELPPSRLRDHGQPIAMHRILS